MKTYFEVAGSDEAPEYVREVTHPSDNGTQYADRSYGYFDTQEEAYQWMRMWYLRLNHLKGE